MGSCFSLHLKGLSQDHHHLNGNTFSHYSLTSSTSYLDFLYPTFSETEANLGYDDGGGGGSGCRTTLPLIDEWGEIVLNDEMIVGPAVITEGETDLAQARHVREAESRGFHDED